MARNADFTWFHDEATSAGLIVEAPSPNERVASGAIAGHPWRVTALWDPSADGPAEFRTRFVAPLSASPAVDLSAAVQDVRPVVISLRRDDRGGTAVGGDIVGGLIVAVFAGLRRWRRDQRTTPRDRVRVSEQPAGIVPQAIIDRLAAWPGDAAYGQPLDVPPESSALARTPEGALTVAIDLSPWSPLTLDTNSFGDAAQFRHAVGTWSLLIEALNTCAALVTRDPATMRRPSTKEVADVTRQVAADLKAAKRNLRP